MTEYEYQTLQQRFSAKLKGMPNCCSNKEGIYNEGVLACKSILKEVYEREKQAQEDRNVRERMDTRRI